MREFNVLICALLVFIVRALLADRCFEQSNELELPLYMQAQEEAKKRLQVAEKNKQELVSDLRKKSRFEYLEKRQADKLVALRDDLADEQDLYSDVR